MDEINGAEESVEGLTPAQVVQMALFFGIKVRSSQCQEVWTNEAK
jgi:hypothetical protein